MGGFVESDGDGRCWGCGYLLRGVESAVCPECGRRFDRGDRSSMNFGRPTGRVGRWAMSGIGWGVVALAAVGCVLILSVTRWPVEGWQFSFADLRYYAAVGEWRQRSAPMTGTDAAYTAGLVACAAAGLWWAVRITAWAWAVARYRPPAFQRARVGGKSSLMLAFLLLALLGVGAGWPYRLGQRWVANVDRSLNVYMNATYPGPNYPAAAPEVPVTLSAEERMVLIRSAVAQGSTPKRRVGGLKVLVETQSIRDALPVLERTIDHEHDAGVRALEARLLGLTGTEEAVRILSRCLNDPEAAVREGAIDGLGVLHGPAWPLEPPSSLPRAGGGSGARMNCDPAIDLPWAWSALTAQGEAVDYGFAARMTAVMTGAPTSGEREAAARAMLNRPPVGYHLRYAEWGVFMADKGRFEFARAQLDEVPPFAHRIGNPARELDGRITPDMRPVWKPVIHLTVDRPMAVDLEVSVAKGRPWVAYPKFDDFVLLQRTPSPVESRGGTLATAPVKSPIEAFDPEGLPFLHDLREGHPWLASPHRLHPWVQFQIIQSMGSNLDYVGGIGVRWQSLIVSPERLGWMSPAALGPAPRFAWWGRLREVESSWVSSRGESERFLYYDGPTGRSPAVNVSLDAVHLRIDHDGRIRLWDGAPYRRGVFVEVGPAGVATRWVDDMYETRVVELGGLTAGPVQVAEGEFVTALEGQGLRATEARGLLACWREAIFRKPGRRFLTFMSGKDYDEACPMKITPAATESARVGIVWTEFPQ